MQLGFTIETGGKQIFKCTLGDLNTILNSKVSQTMCQQPILAIQTFQRCLHN